MAQYLGQVVAVVLGVAIAATPAERIQHAEFCSVFKGQLLTMPVMTFSWVMFCNITEWDNTDINTKFNLHFFSKCFC